CAAGVKNLAVLERLSTSSSRPGDRRRRWTQRRPGNDCTAARGIGVLEQSGTQPRSRMVEQTRARNGAEGSAESLRLAAAGTNYDWGKSLSARTGRRAT